MKETRVVVERSDIPVAGIVSADDLRRLKQLDDDLAERRAVLEGMRAPFQEVLSEEIVRETDRTIKEMREEDQRKRHRTAS